VRSGSSTIRIDPGTFPGGVRIGNRFTAATLTGNALAEGGGIVNIALLALRQTTISGNRVTERGSRGFVEGGGIWSGRVPNGPPSLQLTLVGSKVIRNALSGQRGVVAQGGGIFTAAPPPLTGSVVARNAPDQCHGCDGQRAQSSRLCMITPRVR